MTTKSKGNERWMVMNNLDQTEFWSNDLGWCDYYDADAFTTKQKTETSLPLNGEWLHVGWW